MRVPPNAKQIERRHSGHLAVLVVLSLFTACSGGGPTTVDTSLAFVGSFASATESGTVSFSLASASSGSMVQVNGTTTALTGTYAASTGAVSLSGGGFTFNGTVASGGLTGTFASMKSSGKFSAAQVTAGATTKTFCGSYVTTGDYGWLNLVVSSTGVVSGFTVSGNPMGSSSTITGTLVGTTLTSTTNLSGAINGVVTADGTTFNGTYVPSGSSQTAAGTVLAATTTCGTSTGTTSSTSLAGSWSGNPALATVLNVVFTQTGTTLGGGGAIHVTTIPGYTGDSFRILSGSFTSPNVTFTAQLGANPVGDGTFYIGTMSFTGTESSSTTITGVLTYTPPRTLSQTFPTTFGTVTITR